MCWKSSFPPPPFLLTSETSGSKGNGFAFFSPGRKTSFRKSTGFAGNDYIPSLLAEAAAVSMLPTMQADADDFAAATANSVLCNNDLRGLVLRGNMHGKRTHGQPGIAYSWEGRSFVD